MWILGYPYAFQDLRYLPVFIKLLLSSTVSLLPLFFTPMEQSTKYGLLGAYFTLVCTLLHYTYGLRSDHLPVNTCHTLVLVVLELYKTLFHEWIFPTDEAQFLPLMATSVLCAFGITHSYAHFLFLVLGEEWLFAWEKWKCRWREQVIAR